MAFDFARIKRELAGDQLVGFARLHGKSAEETTKRIAPKVRASKLTTSKRGEPKAK